MCIYNVVWKVKQAAITTKRLIDLNTYYRITHTVFQEYFQIVSHAWDNTRFKGAFFRFILFLSKFKFLIKYKIILVDFKILKT